jgi:hypothetical protein
MRILLSTALASLLLTGFAAYSQSGQSTEGAQRVTNGHITKIDAKKMTLTVRSGSAPQPQTPSRQGNRGGMGRRRNGRGGRMPPSTPKDTGTEFKVVVTDKTTLKDDVTTIGFSLLRVGDEITIQGLPRGSGADLDATQITVNH